jgi:hypothetical protein
VAFSPTREGLARDNSNADARLALYGVTLCNLFGYRDLLALHRPDTRALSGDYAGISDTTV